MRPIQVESSINMEECIARIKVMRNQEEYGYKTGDYLNQYNMSCRTTECQAGHVMTDEADTTITFDIDADCRSKMVTWCYQVIEFCKFNPESAEIAMNYLDRYLMTSEGSVTLFDRSLFQLASMTALYTAVKIHEPEAMDPKLVSKLSRGLYSASEIEEMERDILSALDWRVNPPTSLAFCREFVKLIPEELLPVSMHEAIFTVTKLQTELAVRDYNFLTIHPSSIAFCSFMNALESLVMDEKVLAYIGNVLGEVLGINCNDVTLIQVQSCLYHSVVAVHQQQQQQQSNLKQITTFQMNGTTTKFPRREVVRTVSPRSITGI